MDSPTVALPPRPMNLNELIDAVFHLYRRNFWLLVAVAAVTQIPYRILASFVQSSTEPLTQSINRLKIHPGSSAQVQILIHSFWHATAVELLVLLVFGFVALPLGLAAMTCVGADRYLGRQTSFELAFGAALRRWLPLLGVVLLVVAFIFGAVVALVILSAVLIVALKDLGVLLVILVSLAAVVLGVMAYVRVIVAVPVVVLEPVGPWQSIARSWSLTRCHAWLVFGVLLVLGILTWIVGFAVGVVAGLLAAAGGGTGSVAGHLIVLVFTIIIDVLITPVSVVGTLLLYFNLRGRQEGLDQTQVQPQLAIQP